MSNHQGAPTLANLDGLGKNILDIPSIHVSAPVLPEVISNYSLQIPGDVRQVGVWVGGGQVDGTTGTVLIAGHINWYDQGHGALYDLADIHAGAPIYLSDSAGNVTDWKAISLAAVPKTALPQGIFAPTGSRRLVVVTCGGAFNSQTGHYADNVIMTAAPMGTGTHP